MAQLFAAFEATVKRLNDLFAALASALVLVVVAVVILAIVARGLGISVLWANDVAQIAFVYLVFLSFGPALQTGHHVTVELFEPLVPGPLRKYLDHVAALACLVFGVIFLFQLWRLTSRSLDDGRLALAAIAIPLGWIQIAGPIGLAQFVLTALMNLGLAQRHFGQARSKEMKAH